MSPAGADRNLLFGMLALQMDFLDRDALIAAMHAWVLDKAKPLGDILVAQQILNPDERDALDVLVQKHIDRHQGDVQKSLAAVPIPEPLCQELHSLADPDVQATVDRLPTPDAPPYPNVSLPTLPETPKAHSREFECRALLMRFVAVCNAIAYAHSRGVIHRDLKPANIMLGQYGETLVVDWGMAKVVAEEGKRSESAAELALVPRSANGVQTQHGSAMGTLAYMSPEQASGRLDLLGPASDIYSLGATLYTLLTGRAPIEGKDTAEVLRKAQPRSRGSASGSRARGGAEEVNLPSC